MEMVKPGNVLLLVELQPFVEMVLVHVMYQTQHFELLKQIINTGLSQNVLNNKKTSHMRSFFNV
jgi:hypothetical protein